MSMTPQEHQDHVLRKLFAESVGGNWDNGSTISVESPAECAICTRPITSTDDCIEHAKSHGYLGGDA